MKEITLTTAIRSLGYDELTEADGALVATARAATARAYAPYSHFRVGAAVRLASGTVVTGSNQENAAFPSGTCAERTAAFYAHSSHPDDPFEAIAIAARPEGSEALTAEPVSPCGACRQVLLEYEKLAGKGVRVLLAGEDKVYELPSVASLLPLCFSDF